MNSAAVRTQGDGIEHDVIAETTFKKPQVGAKHLDQSKSGDAIDKLGKDYLSKQTTSSILYDPSDKAAINFPIATLPKGKKFFLIPKLVKTTESRSGLKNRKLNLVLMEPYRVSGCNFHSRRKLVSSFVVVSRLALIQFCRIGRKKIGFRAGTISI